MGNQPYKPEEYPHREVVYRGQKYEVSPPIELMTIFEPPYADEVIGRHLRREFGLYYRLGETKIEEKIALSLENDTSLPNGKADPRRVQVVLQRWLPDRVVSVGDRNVT